MILRGTQIHWDGHGTYGLLPNPTLSSKRPQLPSSGVLANTRMSLCILLSPIATSQTRRYPAFDLKNREPFHMNRAGDRVARFPRT